MSRVAPVGGSTIPRLELLGCLIGARSAESVRSALGLEGVPSFYWTDSTTALSWIKRNQQWGTFVGNRTAEINKLSTAESWKFAPGELNPADFPSRGCSIENLIKSRWWEGPGWLRLPEENWPTQAEEVNEEEVYREVKKTTAVNICVISRVRKQHSFRAIVRVTAWVRRFLYNFFCKDKQKRKSGDLNPEEITTAEIALIKSVQSEAFTSEKDLKGLVILKDDNGVLRVKTRLTYRKDDHDFKFPVVLPGRHTLIQQLSWDTHVEFYHAGAGFLVTQLRSKYWIVHTRRSVKHVIGRCYRCRRYSSKATVTAVAGLPEDRVKNAEPFEVTGVDLAGPFILRNQKKTWLVIYTCAVYHAVHLELIDSLSTTAFIKSLGRFVKKFRRPAIIYSDNGTNFRGAVNLFLKIDWEKVQKDDDVKKMDGNFPVAQPVGGVDGGNG